MNKNELKIILNSIYGFTAMQLIQQVSAINALERTLEDIKNGAKWQSVDLAIESAISALQSVKEGCGINSERSENHNENHDTSPDIPIRNIDHLRSMTSNEVAEFLAKLIFCCSDKNGDKCSDCPMTNAKSCTKSGFNLWLLAPYEEWC